MTEGKVKVLVLDKEIEPEFIDMIKDKVNRYHLDVICLDQELYDDLYIGMKSEYKDCDQRELVKVLYDTDNNVFDKINKIGADVWIAPSDLSLAFLCAWEIDRLDMELANDRDSYCPYVMYGRVKDKYGKPFTLRTVFAPKGKELA